MAFRAIIFSPFRLKRLLTKVKMFPTTPLLSNERTPLIEGSISQTTRTAYALGHVFNDLAAAMWFSYTLLFLQRVALLQPLTAGWLMLLGQVIDALMTPVFGLLIDRFSKRKIWHVIGSIMVGLSFPVIFGSFYRNPNSPTTMFVYVLSIVIFQTGWAAVQISHLSMIPALANTPLLRAELTAIRYSAQVGAAVIVFIVTWIVLPTTENAGARIGFQDNFKFRNIAVVLTLFGATATILFHAFLNARLLEVSRTPPKVGSIEAVNSLEAKLEDSFLGNVEKPAIRQVLPSQRKSTFSSLDFGLLTKVSMLYVASRLFVTLTTVYLPLYIEETNIGGRQMLAKVPLISYASAFTTAIFLKHINRSCGSKVCYLIGSIIGLLAAAVIEFANNSGFTMYTIALMIGAGSSITMVTALSITADLIGPRTESSALIYSIVTFLDKVVTGFVVLNIERWRCLDKDLCPTYNRDSLAAVCASSMAFGLMTLGLVFRSVSTN